MKIPYRWLKEYVDVQLSAEALADRLTMAGLEVDRVEYPYPGVVTAEIVWLERIKGSDHLSATRVTTGDGRELSVVCGAPNIKLHDRVPLAQVGTRVAGVTIQAKKAMGVLSEGMLCSPRELGLGDDHSGILILPEDTPLGVPLGKVLGEDTVIELDLKAHRGDLFCMLGVAREVAAITGQPLRPPAVALKESGTPAVQLVRVDVRDAVLCPRYTARVVRDVRMGPSPAWMAERLTAAGMRPINNVVDVTNYVMLELGQPLHAFDYDKVTDHHIIVRRARAGERITTLDGVDRALSPEMLLITDPTGPNVIAGIFGGARCEVSDATTSVILEAAHFNPRSIRRTSTAIALRTESSSRFEKNLDVTLTERAIDRAAQLLAELTGGTVAPGRVDFYPQPVAPRTLQFDTAQVAWLTGMVVPAGEAEQALEALGFGVAPGTDDRSLQVDVPSWRPDVVESADLVEEVARIAGYERIPSTIPAGPLPEPLHDSWFDRETALREVLLGAGLTETITYTLTSRAAMAKLLVEGATGANNLLTAPASVPELETPAEGRARGRGRAAAQQELEAAAGQVPAIVLSNPLSSEMEALRLTLMVGLLTTLRENSKHSDAGLWFFELGRRYLPRRGGIGAEIVDERRTLGVGLLGPATQHWGGTAATADFYSLKGVTETLLQALQITGYRFVPVRHPSFHPGRCVALELQEAPAEGGVAPGAVAEPGRWLRAGVLGEAHPEVAARFDITGRPYLMELDLERLYAAVPQRVTQTAISRYPAVQRDLALLLPLVTPEVEVQAAILAAGGALVRAARLFDVYTGAGIAANRKSLAYALTYQASDRTLTDAEVDAVQARIVAALASAFGASLRT
jgi:phenylalanyl-tRNA synthetase beta chain